MSKIDDIVSKIRFLQEQQWVKGFDKVREEQISKLNKALNRLKRQWYIQGD